MPANGVVTLNTKAYNPSGTISPGINTWTENSGNFPNGFGVLSCQITQRGASAGSANRGLKPSAAVGNGASGSTKVQWKLKLPSVQATDDGAIPQGSVVGVNTLDIILTGDHVLTKATREELLLQIQDLVAVGLFEDSIEKFEPAY